MKTQRKIFILKFCGIYFGSSLNHHYLCRSGLQEEIATFPRLTGHHKQNLHRGCCSIAETPTDSKPSWHCPFLVRTFQYCRFLTCCVLSYQDTLYSVTFQLLNTELYNNSACVFHTRVLYVNRYRYLRCCELIPSYWVLCGRDTAVIYVLARRGEHCANTDDRNRGGGRRSPPRTGARIMKRHDASSTEQYRWRCDATTIKIVK